MSTLCGIRPPYLNTITDPEPDGSNGGPNREERRTRSGYVSIKAAAEHFHKHPKSIENWLRFKFIRGYEDGNRQIFVSIDEIEAALRINPRMRDGRKRLGGAVIVPLPFRVVADEAEK